VIYTRMMRKEAIDDKISDDHISDVNGRRRVPGDWGVDDWPSMTISVMTVSEMTLSVTTISVMTISVIKALWRPRPAAAYRA
jgi:hypothetical protein